MMIHKRKAARTNMLFHLWTSLARSIKKQQQPKMPLKISELNNDAPTDLNGSRGDRTGAVDVSAEVLLESAGPNLVDASIRPQHNRSLNNAINNLWQGGQSPSLHPNMVLQIAQDN